jgi:L-amino acid N-acyltransferase YncA
MDLLIREATVDDGAAISRIYAHYVQKTPITFEEEVPGAHAMSTRVRDILATHPYLIAQIDGDVAGYAYATKHRERASYRWAVDVTIYLDHAVLRRGIGRALYSALLPLVTAQGYVTAYAGITMPNPASVGIHEAMGFTLVGIYQNVGYKLGAWRDVGWWQRPLAEPRPNPPEPIYWPAMPRFQSRAVTLP